MKTLWRLIVLGVIALVIYFASIGRNDFYRLLDFAEELIELIGNNYMKK